MYKKLFHDNFNLLKESMNTADIQYFSPAMECIELTGEAIRAGKKILLCGNGGSASTASHITNDFIGHMKNWDRIGYPAISLATDISVLTALTNDYGYEYVFSKQILALGQESDILWAFSTSGNSKNIIKAVEVSKEKGIKTIAFTGKQGGLLKDIADLWVPVNTEEAMIAESLHLFYVHSIAESIEAKLSPLS